MLKKLRKIAIDNIEFLYLVTDMYDQETGLNTLTVKVFVSGQKRTPLIIRFVTMQHYYAGQPLKTGINLFHKDSDAVIPVNLNEPKFIHQLIELAFRKEWNGQVQMEVKNGLDWMSELGYDVNGLTEEVEASRKLTTQLKKLGYTKSWLHCGVLTMELLTEQQQFFDTGEDQNTEHYRLGTCVNYLKRKKELSDLELERYFMILKEDPDTYMAGSAAIEVFRWIDLTDEQFTLAANRVSGFGDWTGKIILREQLLRQLKTKPLDSDVIDKCIQDGDSVVQRYLLNHFLLNRDQLEQLIILGKNKEIRTLAKSNL